MAEKNKKEVSFTQGPIFGSIVRFALPVLGALVLQAAYGAVDLLVVGQFGDAASISAVGTGSAFMQMVTFILTSLAMGSTIIIAQHIGEKRPKAAGGRGRDDDRTVSHHWHCAYRDFRNLCGKYCRDHAGASPGIYKNGYLYPNLFRWNSGDYCIQCDQRHPKRRRKR